MGSGPHGAALSTPPFSTCLPSWPGGGPGLLLGGRGAGFFFGSACTSVIHGGSFLGAGVLSDSLGVPLGLGMGGSCGFPRWERRVRRAFMGGCEPSGRVEQSGSQPQCLPQLGVPFHPTRQVVDSRWPWQLPLHPCASPAQRSGRLDKTPEVTGREGQSHKARTPGECISVKEGEPKCPSDTSPKWTGNTVSTQREVTSS